MHSQIVVLGGGPGGYAAAFRAADLGMEVALVETHPQLGGTCLLRGCIPSKALLHVAKVIREAEQANDWGVDFGKPQLDLDKMRARKQQVIESLSGGLSQLAKRRKVRRIHARGTFVDSQTIKLEGGDPKTYQSNRITFDHAIVATGSVPAMPAQLGIDSPRLFDSNVALTLPEVPGSLLIIGGGYIGLEMGTLYAQLGARVSVIEMASGLLQGTDRDLVKPLAKRLGQLFHDILLDTQVVGLTDLGDRVEVEMKAVPDTGSEKGASRSTHVFDRVLVSAGRRPMTDRLGLENTQVILDPQGFIQVGPQLRTGDPHILAIGDATGEPMLAHKASHEGKIAAEGLDGRAVSFNPSAIPAIVFTDPEIAWAGLTAEQAKQEGRPVTTALFPWLASGRAHAMGQGEGLTKWLIDPETDRLLGCGIVGSGAGELIAESVLAIEMGCIASDLADTIHPHPTLSETLSFAAEVYLGAATEIYKPRRNRNKRARTKE